MRDTRGARRARARDRALGAWLGLAGLVWLAGPGNAGAQVADTTGRADTAAIRLAPIVVTASRVPLAANRTGLSVSVVGPREMEAGPGPVMEALRRVEGVFVEEAAGPGGPASVQLRGGEEVFTQVLIDGVQVNQSGGYFDVQGLGLSGLERIEIVRGPQSALYGSSAVSGVVNLLTRAGESGPLRLSFTGQGSNAVDRGGGHRGAVEASGGTEAFRWAASAGWAYSRGIFALAHDTRTRDAGFRVDVVPAPAWRLTGTLRYVGVESMLPVRDPGATRVPLDPNARDARDRVVAALAAEFGASPAWRHELRVSFYGEDFVYVDERDGVAQPEQDFFVFDADFRLDSRLTRPVMEYAADVRPGWAGGGALTYGLRWERERLRDRTAGEFGAGRQVLERANRAGFAEVQLRPSPRIDVLAGLRVEKYEGLEASVTPRASAVMHVRPRRFSVRVATGRAFKAPNLQEQFLENPFIVSNPDLEPETSTSVEAGVDARIGDGLTASLTAFRQRHGNLIRAVATGDGTGRQQNRNLGSSRAQGVEWSVEYRAAGWAAGSNGAWLRTEILDATGLPAESYPEGEALPFRPSVVAGAFVEVAPTERLRVRLRGDLVGSRTVLTERFSGRREVLDPYALAGLASSWDATARWQLFARIDNLFDTAYETGWDRRGIPWTASVGFRWGNR